MTFVNQLAKFLSCWRKKNVVMNLRNT